MKSGPSEEEYGVIDSSGLDTASANAFEVLCNPGEVVLLFGNIHGVDAGQSGCLSGTLSTRIIFSPYLAKRFASQLSNKMAEYESAFGPLVEEVMTAATPSQNSLQANVPDYASEKTVQKANFLIGLINDLNVSYGLERSFKISERSLLVNRFIAGFKKTDIASDPDGKILSAFWQMGMPGRYLDECRDLLHKTEFVHFGFEEQHEGCLYKAYLEFKIKLKFGLDGARIDQEPFLVFLGFKWDPFDNSNCAITRYTCYPLISPENIQEKLACLYERNPDCQSFETAKNVLNKAATIISNNKLIYEEVCEDGNPRKSFDMNLYGANLNISNIYSLLMDAGRHYLLPSDQFIPLCNRISDKKFGHLSGGIDRNGKDFLTIYYGVEAIDK